MASGTTGHLPLLQQRPLSPHRSYKNGIWHDWAPSTLAAAPTLTPQIIQKWHLARLGTFHSCSSAHSHPTDHTKMASGTTGHLPLLQQRPLSPHRSYGLYTGSHAAMRPAFQHGLKAICNICTA